MAQLSSRLERAEGTTQLDRSSLAAVVNQAKALEQTLIQTHGELKGNQSQQSAQLQVGVELVLALLLIATGVPCPNESLQFP